MIRQDNDAAIRDRAYEIWEREGRPSGREHEHWAEAARDIEGAPLEAGQAADKQAETPQKAPAVSGRLSSAKPAARAALTTSPAGLAGVERASSNWSPPTTH